MPNIYQISFAILPPIAACTIPAESYALVWPNDDLCAKTASISYMEIGHEHCSSESGDRRNRDGVDVHQRICSIGPCTVLT